MISKSWRHIKRIFPGAKYNRTEKTWTFPDGEQLMFRHMATPDDYWDYHGHAYPWIGWEELTNWHSADCYTVMMSCCRSTRPDMPRRYRATTNPYGVGHNWIKERFQIGLGFGRVVREIQNGTALPERVAIRGHLRENIILLDADPDYIAKIAAAARNPAELAAWIEGSWDIVSGGMFDDVWDARYHVLPPLPVDKIPPGWHIDRSFDWGSSKPFSVCWWAESNGEPVEHAGYRYGSVRGDLIMIKEWYGWTGKRNEGVRMLRNNFV